MATIQLRNDDGSYRNAPTFAAADIRGLTPEEYIARNNRSTVDGEAPLDSATLAQIAQQAGPSALNQQLQFSSPEAQAKYGEFGQIFDSTNNYQPIWDQNTGQLQSLMVKTGDKNGTKINYALQDGQYVPVSSAEQYWNTNGGWKDYAELIAGTLAVGGLAAYGAYGGAAAAGAAGEGGGAAAATTAGAGAAEGGTAAASGWGSTGGALAGSEGAYGGALGGSTAISGTGAAGTMTAGQLSGGTSLLSQANQARQAISAGRQLTALAGQGGGGGSGGAGFIPYSPSSTNFATTAQTIANLPTQRSASAFGGNQGLLTQAPLTPYGVDTRTPANGLGQAANVPQSIYGVAQNNTPTLLAQINNGYTTPGQADKRLTTGLLRDDYMGYK